MSARERLNMAREQAGRELVALPLRRRIRIYLGGISGCDHWIDRRAAEILASAPEQTP